MEQFVKSLFDRLDSNGQMQLICIMENAINEIHNNGIVSQVDISGTSKLHDPDPNVRVTKKTRLAKAVGHSFVASSTPGITENGIGHTIKINNDPHFPNSIAICIQGGLEGLFQAGIFRENESGVMDYNIIIDDRGQDTSALEKNISVLNGLYDEFGIRVSHSDFSDREQNGTEKPKKKKGLFAKLFGK